jgi:phospholipase D1/2
MTIDAESKTFTREGNEVPGFSSSVVPTHEASTVVEHWPPKEQTDVPPEKDKLQPQTFNERPHTEKNSTFYTNGTANGKPPEVQVEDGTLLSAPGNAATSTQIDDASSEIEDDEEEKAATGARTPFRKYLNHKTWALQTPRPCVVPEGFEDPISDGFWKNVWFASAVHNVRTSFFRINVTLKAPAFQTEIYRRVFHAIPDDQVTTWKQYKEFILHHERLKRVFVLFSRVFD